MELLDFYAGLKETFPHYDFYQDWEINGEIIVKGSRNCLERWNLIKEIVPTTGTILEIGSNVGYFSFKLAENSNRVVWGIENGEIEHLILKELAKIKQLPNVLFSKKTFSLLDAVLLASSCNFFDTIILTSTLHYWPVQEAVQILRLLSTISPQLIIDFPPIEEETVCYYDRVQKLNPIESLLKKFYKDVNLIGITSAPSTTNISIQRPLFNCYNPTLERHNVLSYIGGEESSNRHSILYKEKQWFMDNRTIKPGLNLWDLLYFSFQNYPYLNLDRQLDQRLEDLFSTDLAPWNILYTLEGLEIIDKDEFRGKEVLGKSWEDYKKEYSSILESFKKQLKAVLVTQDITPYNSYYYRYRTVPSWLD